MNSRWRSALFCFCLTWSGALIGCSHGPPQLAPAEPPAVPVSHPVRPGGHRLRGLHGPYRRRPGGRYPRPRHRLPGGNAVQGRGGGQKEQWPDTELELQGFLTYPLVMASHSTDCTGTWRSAGCLTNGRRIPISLCGNSTSSTVLVRPVGG